MKVLDGIARVLSQGKQKTFEELPSWILVIMGTLTFLTASYPGLMFAEVVPDFIKKVNEVGVTAAATGIAIILALYAIPTWVFGCVAGRCHTVLYERYFK